jgi:hypothetical protein
MRRGISLIEAVVFLLVGAIVLGIVASMNARLARHDVWNASRLSALESVLLAWEHIQVDLACAGRGRVEPGEDGRSLAIERAASARGERTESIEYAKGTSRALQRAGRPLGSVRLDAAEFAWRDEPSSMLQVRLASGGDRIEAGVVASAESVLTADVQVTGRARRAEFPGWVDEE